MQKTCSRCSQTKPLTPEFWLPRKGSRDGYRGVCRLCWYAQQRPNKRRHYARHRARILAERQQDRQRNPERRRMADLCYHLKHRESRLEYNRRYYWQNHERLLSYKRWYVKHVRPLRIQFGDLPTDAIDAQMWQRQQDRQQAQAVAVAILSLMMQAMTVEERRFLMAFDHCNYDMAATADCLRMGIDRATQTMQRIRDVAIIARKVETL
jgi:hypothetical protein